MMTGETVSPKPVRGRKVEPPVPGDHTPQRFHGVKIELGRRWSEIVREVADGHYTWDEFAESLTPEELARGQLRDRNGNFVGRPPALVPRSFFDACMREIHRRFNEKMQTRLLDAAEELIELSRADGGMKPKDRADVLRYLMERVMGPVPKEVKITTDATIGSVLQGFVRPAVDGGEEKAPAPKDRYAKRRATVKPEEDTDD